MAIFGKKADSNESEVLTRSKLVNMPVLFFGGGAGHIIDCIAQELSNADVHNMFERVNLTLHAFNTDSEDLHAIHKSVNKVLIGQEETGGYGAGARPELGKAAAVESKQEIVNCYQDADIAIFLTCLGGGTGTGAIVFAVQEYKKLMENNINLKLHQQKSAVVIVTMPFDSQDAPVKLNAEKAYRELVELGVPVIPIYNDAFLPKDADLQKMTLNEMFAIGNKPLAHSIARMVRALGARHDQFNIDRNDIVSHILLNAGEPPLAYYGVGYMKKGETITDAFVKAASNPILETTLSNCVKAVISVDCKGLTAGDWQQFQAEVHKQRKRPDADWPIGVNVTFEPFGFERENDYEGAVFIIGVGCNQTSFEESQGTPQLDFTPKPTNGNGSLGAVTPAPTHIKLADVLGSMDSHHETNLGMQ